LVETIVPGRWLLISLSREGTQRVDELINRPYTLLVQADKRNRILIVDEDEEAGDALSQMLTRLGYLAVSCDDPYQALNLFEDGPDRFDIVIIDQAIPKATGTELATLLLRIRDDLPMVLLTGRGDPISPDKARLAGFRATLAKPVLKEQIKEVVESIMESRGLEGL
jgi:two-component system, cell cycle sensor histidine kinase and response regulator CckA